MTPYTILRNSGYEIRTTDSRTSGMLTLEREWVGGAATARLTNRGPEAIGIVEIALFTGGMPFTPDTQVYGEGYNMLSQYAGMLSSVEPIGQYTDAGHYRLPQKAGFTTVYNLVLFSPVGGSHVLWAFTSCRRFSSEIRLSGNTFEIVLDTEGKILAPGETWILEDFLALEGGDREELLSVLADELALRHPRLPWNESPTGWCSWYCYGPEVTERDVIDNLEAISNRSLGLTYVQIDDGYQPFMGDWLETDPGFPGGIGELCRMIADRGFVPAIWVAPFIAEKDSRLFREHPDWFVSDADGAPLPSDRHSFGGWRRGPWYMLDCTHPDALDYIRLVFTTMRDEWKCRYFKLDAVMWAALPWGERHDPDMTRVEAYRKGMETIVDAVGRDCFILIGNQPNWPSLGLTHAVRQTNDITRSWKRFVQLSRECFPRNWQHGKLWINDPDCIVLQNLGWSAADSGGRASKQAVQVSDNEFSFHFAYIAASGGMVLSGDKIPELTERSERILASIIALPKLAARFEDPGFRVGRITGDGKEVICFLNPLDETSVLTAACSENTAISPLFGNPIYEVTGDGIRVTLPPRSGAVLVMKGAS